MRKSKLDQNGHEILDPTPKSIPVGFKRPETLQEQIRRLVRTEVSEAAGANGWDTFEEADDFEIDDDPEIPTPYEMEFDQTLGREVSPQMLKDDAEEWRKRYIERAKDDDLTDARLDRAKRKRSFWPFPKRQSDIEDGSERRQRGPSQTKAPDDGADVLHEPD